ncbi:MAG: RNA 2',3'-cyclic phosphodiesterase [archaeon]|nr:RNA 2',3'-cyclic phosphodiesterase [archaeon]
MNNEKLFVYGTLKDKAVQLNVIGRVIKGSDDVLNGYIVSKIIINGDEYPVLLRGQGKIEGKLLSINSEELGKIDYYETSTYIRKKVKLESGEDAWVYVKGEENKLTRTFIAIDFPDEIIKEVARIGEVLGKKKFTGKLTELENLHLTLKFLGEIDEKKMEEVRARLKEAKVEEMDLKLGEIGVFGIRGSPRIVWIKIEGKQIWDLQKRIDEALKGEGMFEPEERFMSHLTIARVKYVKDKKGFIDAVKGMKVKDIKFKIDSFELKSSELKPLGPVYRTIEKYCSEKLKYII